MQPEESCPTDEFVSGQNLDTCDSELMRSPRVLLHQQAPFRCVKGEGERGKCGFLKGQKRGPTGW